MAQVVSKKLGIKKGMRTLLINAPPEAHAVIDLSIVDVASELSGEFDYLHLFTTTQADFSIRFPQLKAHLKSGGMLWVSWPKAGGLGTDLSLPIVIRLGYDYGLVESKTISINATWSAIKFTHPVDGKIYQNSYGTLPQ